MTSKELNEIAAADYFKAAAEHARVAIEAAEAAKKFGRSLTVAALRECALEFGDMAAGRKPGDRE